MAKSIKRGDLKISKGKAIASKNEIPD